MEKSKKLTPKQELFCQQYVIDRNGTQAAIRAGYKATTATVQASALLTIPNVHRRVAELIGKAANNLEITVERVLKERARLAFVDPRRFFRSDGTPIPITELDPDVAACIAGYETIDKYDPRTESTHTITKLKFVDKTASLNALDKHLGLYEADNKQVSESLSSRLDAAIKARRID